MPRRPEPRCLGNRTANFSHLCSEARAPPGVPLIRDFKFHLSDDRIWQGPGPGAEPGLTCEVTVHNPRWHAGGVACGTASVTHRDWHRGAGTGVESQSPGAMSVARVTSQVTECHVGSLAAVRRLSSDGSRPPGRAEYSMIRATVNDGSLLGLVTRSHAGFS